MADVAATGVAQLAERPSARVARPGSTRLADRLELRQVLGYDALSLLALSALAVAQPLLDLFGKNPEFFLAADASRGQIVAFALIVTFGVPLVAIAIELVAHAIGHRVGLVVHAALIGILGTAFGATVARQFQFTANLAVVAVSLAIGIAILVAERRTKAMRLGLRYLSLASLLFLAMFLFTSSTSRLLWEDEAHAETGIAIDHPRPVVMVVFDEFPVASIIDTDGQIDATRFPNFARLAQHSTWFRNATSLSPNTPGSVPTIESGLEPKGGDALPTSVDYPRNLFTLLGGSYHMDVTETITELCPTTVCARVDANADKSWWSHLGSTLEDASVVYGHATLPPSLRADLPAVDTSWGGFLQGAPTEPLATATTLPPPTTTTTRPNIGDFMSERNHYMAANQPRGVGELLRRMTARIGSDGASHLYFVHDALFPHFNWRTTPDGHTYPGQGGPPGTVDGGWGRNEFLIRQGQQRHLLQVGYADTLLGQLIDRMQQEGIWDDAVLVVTADHGIAFTADHPKRTPTEDTKDEIYRVPMFVRVPGEREGEVSDENAINDDLLPTIVDALGVHTDWQFDGRSLLSDPPQADKPVFYASGPSSMSDSLDGLLAVARRNHERFPEPGWRGVAAVGDLGQYVGQPVSALGAVPMTADVDSAAAWRVDHPERFQGLSPDGGAVPLVVTGTMRLERGHRPYREALVAVNGTIAGVAGDFQQVGDKWHFSSLVDFEQFEAGDNDVQLYIVGGGGDQPAFYEVPKA